MASIKIHQDTYNFVRRRAGFTTRQIKALVVAGIIAVAVGWVLMVPLGISYAIAPLIAALMAFPALIAGFMPVYGMPMEVFLARGLDERGTVLVAEQEELELQKGDLSREHIKARKKRSAERRGAVQR